MATDTIPGAPVPNQANGSAVALYDPYTGNIYGTNNPFPTTGGSGTTNPPIPAPITGSPLLFHNSYLTTPVTKGVIKASAAQLLSFNVTNMNSALRYMCFFNKASAPVAGTDTPVPGCVFIINAGIATVPGERIMDISFFANIGDYFSTGLAWAISTTPTFAADSAIATDHFLNGRYA